MSSGEMAGDASFTLSRKCINSFSASVSPELSMSSRHWRTSSSLPSRTAATAAWDFTQNGAVASTGPRGDELAEAGAEGRLTPEDLLRELREVLGGVRLDGEEVPDLGILTPGGERRGVLAALFLLCNALGGAVGDPMNGAAFDLFDSYRPLFLMMAGYTALAFVAVLFIPRGTGEADTGPATA